MDVLCTLSAVSFFQCTPVRSTHSSHSLKGQQWLLRSPERTSGISHACQMQAVYMPQSNQRRETAKSEASQHRRIYVRCPAQIRLQNFGHGSDTSRETQASRAIRAVFSQREDTGSVKCQFSALITHHGAGSKASLVLAKRRFDGSIYDHCKGTSKTREEKSPWIVLQPPKCTRYH